MSPMCLHVSDPHLHDPGLGSMCVVRGGEASGFTIRLLCSLPQFRPPPSAPVQHIQKLLKCKAIYNTEQDLIMDKASNKPTIWPLNQLVWFRPETFKCPCQAIHLLHYSFLPLHFNCTSKPSLSSLCKFGLWGSKVFSCSVPGLPNPFQKLNKKSMKTFTKSSRPRRIWNKGQWKYRFNVEIN